MNRSRVRDERGQAMIMASMVLVVLLGVTGLAVDAGYLYHYRRSMQTAADAGALGGGSEIERGQTGLIHGSALRETANNNFANASAGIAVTVNYPPATGFYTGDNEYVEVTVRQSVPPTFMQLFGFSSVPIAARAVAGVGANSRNCIYALNPTKNNALSITGGSIVDVHCGIVVDSGATQAMVASGGSCVTSTSNTVTGSFTQGSCAISPAPRTAVPPLPDPLAYVSPPAIGACDHINFKASNGTYTVDPGVYCGGITISVGTVTFNPGVYILEGGGLTASGASNLYGDGVMFYNTAAAGYAYKPITLSGSGAMTLTAPTTGAYAGILFFQDRTIVSSSKNTISGTSSSKIEGALYFPTTQLVYSGGSSAASHYMFIVADTIEFSGGSSLIGADYSGLPGGSPLKRLTLVE